MARKKSDSGPSELISYRMQREPYRKLLLAQAHMGLTSLPASAFARAAAEMTFDRVLAEIKAKSKGK